MKLSATSLLSVLICGVSASQHASVYMFQGHSTAAISKPPNLSPEEARLIFAQRLGVSQYHNIGSASASTLDYINTFGGQQESVFQESERNEPPELLFFVEGASSKMADTLLGAWPTVNPAFTISNPPSRNQNAEFVEDLRQQVGVHTTTCVSSDAVNPFKDPCWHRRAWATRIDLTQDDRANEEFVALQERLNEYVKLNEIKVTVVLMPESGSGKKSKSYRSYEMPSQRPISRRQAEETLPQFSRASSAALKSNQVISSNLSEPVTGVPRVCYSSLNSCIQSTKNCSGHGQCYVKFGSAKGEDASSACFACGCVATEETFQRKYGEKPLQRITYWGGAACQKQDVSSPFWLLAIFTVVMLGLVGWAIGLLFSIGEEKLPGVIGAGVPSKSR